MVTDLMSTPEVVWDVRLEPDLVIMAGASARADITVRAAKPRKVRRVMAAVVGTEEVLVPTGSKSPPSWQTASQSRQERELAGESIIGPENQYFRFDFSVPPDGLPSAETSKLRVRWSVVAWIDVGGAADPSVNQPFFVPLTADRVPRQLVDSAGEQLTVASDEGPVEFWAQPAPLVAGLPLRGAIYLPDRLPANARLELKVASIAMRGGWGGSAPDPVELSLQSVGSGDVIAPFLLSGESDGPPYRYSFSGEVPAVAAPTTVFPHGAVVAFLDLVISQSMRGDRHIGRPVAIVTEVPPAAAAQSPAAPSGVESGTPTDAVPATSYAPVLPATGGSLGRRFNSLVVVLILVGFYVGLAVFALGNLYTAASEARLAANGLTTTGVVTARHFYPASARTSPFCAVDYNFVDPRSGQTFAGLEEGSCNGTEPWFEQAAVGEPVTILFASDDPTINRVDDHPPDVTGPLTAGIIGSGLFVLIGAWIFIEWRRSRRDRVGQLTYRQPAVVPNEWSGVELRPASIEPAVALASAAGSTATSPATDGGAHVQFLALDRPRGSSLPWLAAMVIAGVIGFVAVGIASAAADNVSFDRNGNPILTIVLLLVAVALSVAAMARAVSEERARRGGERITAAYDRHGIAMPAAVPRGRVARAVGTVRHSYAPTSLTVALVTFLVLCALSISVASVSAGNAARSSAVQSTGIAASGTIRAVGRDPHNGQLAQLMVDLDTSVLGETSTIAYDPAPVPPVDTRVNVLVDPADAAYAELPGLPYVGGSNWLVPASLAALWAVLALASAAALWRVISFHRNYAHPNQPAP